MKYFLLLLLCTWTQVQAGEIKLTAYEEGATISGANMAYSLGLLTLNTETFETGIEPYVCWPFAVEWEVFYVFIEANVKEQLAAMTVQQRKGQGENFKYRVWQAVTEEWGCW
jgi:hypothetical protein